jgi:hypothetical protein
MKRTVVCLALVGLLAIRGQAAAVICTIDQVPAATLLLPYFVVDLSNPNGLTTLFSVNNASATAVLVHVTMWSDLSVVVLDFNIYLTGYDVQTVNLRDIIVNGNLPQTASAGQDPSDTISPHGIVSQDINFASCTGSLPYPNVGQQYITHMESALTGGPSAFYLDPSSGTELCVGQALGDNFARGYITMDTVNSCNTLNPGDTNYFAVGGTGIATDQNVLWGDWFIVNSTENYADGGDLVHIEADPTNPATSTAGRYTFYGRYDNWSAADNREPLATQFATRFIDGGPFPSGTSFLVWRDSKVKANPFVCPATFGIRPPWYPLSQEGIVIFDEQEHPVVLVNSPISPPPVITTTLPFPAETQRVPVGGTGPLASPYSFGWMILDLNTTVAAAGANPPFDPAAAQAYVFTNMSNGGHYAVGIEAIRLDSACTPVHFVPVNH